MVCTEGLEALLMLQQLLQDHASILTGKKAIYGQSLLTISLLDNQITNIPFDAQESMHKIMAQKQIFSRKFFNFQNLASKLICQFNNSCFMFFNFINKK